MQQDSEPDNPENGIVLENIVFGHILQFQLHSSLDIPLIQIV